MLDPVKMKRDNKRNGLNLVSDIMWKSIQNGVFGAGVKHE